MQIPWKMKSAAFAVLDLLGPNLLYAAQKHVTRRSLPHWDRPPTNWVFHRDRLRAANTRRIIEFGAGKSLAQNLYLGAQIDGIEQVLVDINPMIDLDLVNAAIGRLDSLGLPMKGRVTSLDDLARTYAISYHAPVDMQMTPFEAGSFDACISTNTLEHIPRDVIADIWRECRRILVPGGIVSARIDYSDHYAHTDRRIGRLNFLSYDEAGWRRHNHDCHFQNRLRHRHHLDLMEAAGLAVEWQSALAPCEPPRNVAATTLAGDPTDFHTGGMIVARSP